MLLAILVAQPLSRRLVRLTPSGHGAGPFVVVSDAPRLGALLAFAFATYSAIALGSILGRSSGEIDWRACVLDLVERERGGLEECVRPCSR